MISALFYIALFMCKTFDFSHVDTSKWHACPVWSPSQRPAVVAQTFRGQPRRVHRPLPRGPNGSVVDRTTPAAGSSTSAGLRWHGDIWPRSISGSGSDSGTNILRPPHLRRVSRLRCLLKWCVLTPVPILCASHLFRARNHKPLFACEGWLFPWPL